MRANKKCVMFGILEEPGCFGTKLYIYIVYIGVQSEDQRARLFNAEDADILPMPSHSAGDHQRWPTLGSTKG